MYDSTSSTYGDDLSSEFGGPVPGGDPFADDPFGDDAFASDFDVPEGAPKPPSFTDDVFGDDPFGDDPFGGESYATKSRESAEEVSDKKAAFIETVEEIHDALPEGFACYTVEASDTRPYTIAESDQFTVVAKTMKSSKLYLEAKEGQGTSEDAQIQAARTTERLQSALTDRDVTPEGYEPWSAEKVAEAITERAERAERAAAHAEAIKENQKRDEQERAEQERAERKQRQEARAAENERQEAETGVRTVRTPEGEILTIETAKGGDAPQITLGFEGDEDAPGEYLDAGDAARRIKSRPGEETTVYFRKRTQRVIRRMVFSYHPRERGQAHDKKNNLVRVYDLEKEGLRSISLERVLDVQDEDGQSVADPLEVRAQRRAERRAQREATERAPVPVY